MRSNRRNSFGSLVAAGVLGLASWGAQAQLEFSEPPEGHNFGKIPLGATYAAQYFGLFNRGSTPVAVGQLRVDGQMATCAALGCPVVAPEDFELRSASDGCSNRTLAGGEACSSLVVFSPKAPGARTARIVFALQGSAVMARVLNGTGVADPTDCVLDWAERQLPTLLTSPTPTLTSGPFYARCYAGSTICIGADAAALTLAPASVYVLMNGQLTRYAALGALAAVATHEPPSALTCDQPRPQP